MNPVFTYRKTHDGNWEVLLRGAGGRKSHLPRRLCLCTHENDAEVIADAMQRLHLEEPEGKIYEYYYKTTTK